MVHKYQSMTFSNLLGIQYLSDKSLNDHFFLYEGYVKNTNKLIQELDVLSKEGLYNTPEFSEMKRRFGWEWNGIRLHELYFSNMIKGGNFLGRDTNLFKKIVRDFGSYDNWEKDFKAIGLIRGMGWTILCYGPFEDRLFNVWINEHNTGHLCTAFPILVMDMFEHAYIMDYGTDKKKYIDSFFKMIDWEAVSITSGSWFI